MPRKRKSYQRHAMRVLAAYDELHAHVVLMAADKSEWPSIRQAYTQARTELLGIIEYGVTPVANYQEG